MSQDTSDRDPRIDPKPGDAISRHIPQALNGIILREVERAHGGFVGFYSDNGNVRKWSIIHLAAWRDWAKKAEVVEYAAD